MRSLQKQWLHVKITIVGPSCYPLPIGTEEVSQRGGIWIGDMNSSEDSSGLGLLRVFGSFVDHDVLGFRRGINSYPYSGSKSRKKSKSYQRQHCTIVFIAPRSTSGNSDQGGPTSDCGSDCGSFPCAIAPSIL